eukprot:5788238-Pyramimonas_sp.AAC.1
MRPRCHARHAARWHRPRGQVHPSHMRPSVTPRYLSRLGACARGVRMSHLGARAVQLRAGGDARRGGGQRCAERDRHHAAVAGGVTGGAYPST